MAYRERFERELADLGLSEHDTGSPARDVVVGERVVLDVKDTPYSDYEVVKVAWVIPDTVVKGYSATRKKTTLERLTPSDREKSKVVFFWVDAGKRDVRLNITFKTGGVEKTGNATVTFNVVAPKLNKFDDTSSTPRIIKNGSLRGVRFGEIKKDHGVHWDWKVTLPAKYGGSIKDVQTIRQSREKSVKKDGAIVRKVRRHPTKKDSHEQLDQPMLDAGTEPTYSAKGAYKPSEFPMSLAAGKSWRDNHSWDSPHTSLDPEDQVVTVNDKFKYYILFKPDTADAIWVPIAKAEWFWSFEAKRGKDGWTLASKGGKVTKKGALTTEFPEYETNVSFNDWVEVTAKDKEANLQEFEVGRSLEINVRRAAHANRALARSLGWSRNLRRVVQLIDLRRQSFPQAVAAWQRSHGLPADGVIGPGTWARMQQGGARRVTEREVDVPREYDVLLTKGQVGKAFARSLKFTSAPDDVINAIASSKTFQEKVKAIEAKYVALDDVAADETVVDGTITSGKRAKKPVLAVSVDRTFSAFATVGSIDSMVEQDTIILQLPDSPSTAELVQQIALGTARAYQWVTRRNRSDEPNANILNALKRDMLALQDADIIVGQAYASKELKGQKKPPGLEGLPENFQRAPYGSQFLHTGLEHHVLNEFATGEIIKSKLTRNDIRRAKVAADALDITARPLADYISDPSPLFVTTTGGSPVQLDSKYAEQRAVLRVLDARWKTLGDIAKAEIGVVTGMLEDHQAAFFQGVIRYPKLKTPRP
jgi:hypothetical protein